MLTNFIHIYDKIDPCDLGKKKKKRKKKEEEEEKKKDYKTCT